MREGAPQTIEGAGTNGGDLTVPRITTREIITTATVPNNNTIVLGGLIVGRNKESKSGIPILGDIPYLGRLFSTTTNTDDRSELMVFIQPSIVNSDRSLGDVQSDMDNRYKASPRVRDFADGDSLDGIPPVEDKGKGGSTVEATPSTSTMKPSIRPAHRR